MLNNINININPIEYVKYKEKEVTIDNTTSPVAKVEKINNKLYVKIRRFDTRDRSELSSPITKEVSLHKLNIEKAFCTDYLNKLNILIKDLEEINT